MIIFYPLQAPEIVCSYHHSKTLPQTSVVFIKTGEGGLFTPPEEQDVLFQSLKASLVGDDKFRIPILVKRL